MCPAASSDSRRAPTGRSGTRPNFGKSESALSAPTQMPADPLASNHPFDYSGGLAKIRVQISTQNELVRESLSRALAKVENIDLKSGVSEAKSEGASHVSSSVQTSIDVFILISGEKLHADLDAIRGIRAGNSQLKILFLGTAREEGDFLQYVRAGINGFLWRDASTEDVGRAIENLNAGKAVCPGELCAALFRYFEDSEPQLPFASPTQRLGLTRREQQIVPLIAKGLTNKEIANHFCLSEQTVKNHLYRMKHKTGAEDRLSIVQKFRHHGLLL
jgi:DNA-binding NarL/FixJ family response regulator